MLNTNQGSLIEIKQASVRSLYDRHAAKLLGYIFDVVKDRKVAEDYLVKIFCDISMQFNEAEWDGVGSWCKLQRFAKSKLLVFIESDNCVALPDEEGLILHDSRGKYLSRLNDEQKHIFSDVYYYGKTIATISIELKKTEESIRKTLKEAFVIMRKEGEN